MKGFPKEVTAISSLQHSKTSNNVWQAQHNESLKLNAEKKLVNEGTYIPKPITVISSTILLLGLESQGS